MSILNAILSKGKDAVWDGGEGGSMYPEYGALDGPLHNVQPFRCLKYQKGLGFHFRKCSGHSERLWPQVCLFEHEEHKDVPE